MCATRDYISPSFMLETLGNRAARDARDLVRRVKGSSPPAAPTVRRAWRG